MSRKITLSLIGLLILLCFIGIVYAMGEKPPKEGKAIPDQEYTTYVCKAGFSVSYPKEWYLEENKGAGWKVGSEGPAFTIANMGPKFYMPSGGNNIEIFFANFVDDLKGSPSDAEGKLKYFAKKHGMRSIDEIKIVEHKNSLICWAYGMPRGHSDKYNVLFFYLPKTKKIASAIVYSPGEYSIEQLIEMIPIKIER